MKLTRGNIKGIITGKTHQRTLPPGALAVLLISSPLFRVWSSLCVYPYPKGRSAEMLAGKEEFRQWSYRVECALAEKRTCAEDGGW